MSVLQQKKDKAQTKDIVKEDKLLDKWENHLYLMEIYLSEWQHRDNLFWKQIFTYCIATIFVMCIPYMDIWNLKLDEKFPKLMFPIVGVVMAILFLYVSLAYSKRLLVASKIYRELIEKLPNGCRCESMPKIFSKSIACIISSIMFGGLIVLGVMLIIVTI